MTMSVDPDVSPSGTGCVECLDAGGWWLHLRRCTECGHIGCCDNSLGKHATAHATSSGHPVICSFEPGEDWFWNYRTNGYMEGPPLAPPLPDGFPPTGRSNCPNASGGAAVGTPEGPPRPVEVGQSSESSKPSGGPS
jgi:hypothetical protein